MVSGTGIAIAKNFGGKAVVSATDGLLIIGYPNAQGRIKFKVGRIGKNGIKSGVRYTLDKDHKFIEIHAKKRAK